MCGVVGYWPVAPTRMVAAAFSALFDESCVRGLHAYGLATPGRAVRSFDSGDIKSSFDSSQPNIAHARYCTSGDWRTLGNNQPIIVGKMALAFNGVIHMGTKAEFEAAFGVSCVSDNDGEVFLRRLEVGESAARFICRILGSFAGVWLIGRRLFAGRNARRPLWYHEAYGACWYASTADIFRRASFPAGAVEVLPGIVEEAGCRLWCW